jgi:hypothetical protein
MRPDVGLARPIIWATTLTCPQHVETPLRGGSSIHNR